MKLTVNNLGAVSHAEIDLDKRLLIFTGENNTGKTYLVYTVYFSYIFEFYGYEELPSVFSNNKNITINLNENYKINLLDLMSNTEYLGSYQKFVSQNMQKQLSDFFSAPKTAFDKTFISLEINEQDISQQAILDFEINTELDSLLLTKKSDSLDAVLTNTKIETYKVLEKDFEQVDYIIYILFYHSMHSSRTCIFPAEREGINLFNKELLLFRNKAFQKLISEKKQTKELVDFMQTRFDRYPQPIRDALNGQNNYDVIKSKTSDYAYLAKELEDTFLKGDIVLNTEGDVVFKPQSMDKPLDIHLTSSTVKSLSSLIVYLRHTAKKGDFIIIDEPELNLHPDNQRKIARFFGRLINEGFKVLISTHSDYIVRELNNLIMLSHGFTTKKADTLALLERYNYTENELIAAEKVGVYLFRVGQPVENVVVEDTGFNIATIDEEIRKLNQSSQDIYFTLFDQ